MLPAEVADAGRWVPTGPPTRLPPEPASALPPEHLVPAFTCLAMDGASSASSSSIMAGSAGPLRQAAMTASTLHVHWKGAAD